MSPVQNTDLFLVDRGGASFRVTAANLDTLQTNDQLLVQRGGQSFRCAFGDRGNIQDTDLLLVNRGGQAFRVPWSEVRQALVYEIGNSVRFRGSQILSRENDSDPTGTTSTYTLSLWAKLGVIYSSTISTLMGANNNSAQQFNVTYSNTNCLFWLPNQNATGGTSAASMESTIPFRDPSAWYHFVLQYNPGASEYAVFVNGVQISDDSDITSYSTTPNWFGNGNTMYIGGISDAGTNQPFIGYVAEAYGIDGQVVAPTAFGEFNDDGVWVPIDYTGTFGNNGYHLDFADTDNPGNDVSGNNNDFTNTGFELTTTTDVDYDPMTDSPTQNFSTLNPLKAVDRSTEKGVTANANLAAGGFNSSTLPAQYSSIRMPATGLYYFEWQVPANLNAAVGITYNVSSNDNSWVKPDTIMWFDAGSDNNTIRINNVTQSGGSTPGSFRNDGGVGGALVNMGANDTATPGITYTLDGSNPMFFEVPAGFDRNEIYFNAVAAFSNNGVCFINYGQQPFQNQPAGSSALQTQNLPAAPIADATAHFRALTGDGANILAIAQGTNTGGTNWKTGVNTGFANGFYWIKRLAGTNQHQLFNSMNGTTSPNVRDSPQGAGGAYVAPAGNSVAYCWSAPDEMPQATREAGDIDVTSGRTNVTAGFSMINYTGNGSSNQSIAHGLGTQPDFVIAGCRRTTEEINTSIWNSALNSANSLNRLVLETNNSVQTSQTNCWGTSFPNNQFFFVGSDSFCNKNNTDYTMYLFTSIVGYSHFGIYVGNSGTENNGTFVFTGFRPAFVMIKNSSASANWIIADSTQEEFNPCDTFIFPSTTGGATVGNNNRMDFLSNGFMLRGNDQQTNDDNRTYLYAAFAEVPFGGSNVIPANAR